MRRELYEHYFNGKKVTVMGLGLLGRGVGDTAFLAEHGAELIVTDKKEKESLMSSLTLLEQYTSITYSLGGHRYEDFEGRDFILKAAGVPYDSEYITHARERGIQIYMSAALLSYIVKRHSEGVTIIGVTGTRGKTTVTELIAHILRQTGFRVHVGGNVRGVANLPLLEGIEEGDFLLMELDSWQLQGFGDLKISPNIAVFTSFMDDHMNYYKNDKELYFCDKANIYRYQEEYDVLVAGSHVADVIRAHDPQVSPIVPEEGHYETSLIGTHNQLAVSLAYEVALQCGLEDEEIRKAITTFNGVEGRLQDLGLYKNGTVRVFNDNNATTPDATIAALRAITATYNKQPILITGGTDKGLPLEMLEQEIASHTKACVFLQGTGTDRFTLTQVHSFETLAECVQEAFTLAHDGDIILFSPAFASFSKEFNNEYERNDLFVEETKKFL